MSGTVRAQPTVAGLEASAPQALPFAPALEIRAFRLRRPQGDLLVYSAEGADGDGVARHYLNHRHEAMFPAAGARAPLFCHERERAAVERTYAVRATFSRRHTLDEDFEIIPTPGHTSGATAYLWDTGEHRVLFTGDTVYLDRGEWIGAVLGSSDRAAYLDSLELIRGLDFDVLVPWAATRGEPWLAFTDRADATRRIGAIIDRVRGGADG